MKEDILADEPLDFGENKAPHRPKRKKVRIKKANHRHEYKNCLFEGEDFPYLGSYCTICGHVGSYQKDARDAKKLQKKFPDEYISLFLRKEVYEYIRENGYYPVFKINWNDKFVNLEA